jgi:hypothetical protein
MLGIILSLLPWKTYKSLKLSFLIFYPYFKKKIQIRLLAQMTSLEVNGTETWTDVSWVEKVLELKRYLVVVYGGSPYDIHRFEID